MEPLIIPIHFGNLQGKHEISTDTLFVFIDSYKEIAEIFGIGIEIQIGIPEEGGWKTNLIFVISLLGLNPIVALLTGETTDDWAKKGHIEIVRLLNEFVTKEAARIPDEFPKDCVKQKNKIYQQFQRDDCIVSFRLDGFPVIPSENFHLYIKKIEDDSFIYLGETDITVHSPDWKGKRSWRGKIEILEDNESAFDFDKDLTGKFWEKVKLDSLPLHTTDVMRVQLVKRPSSKVKYLVIRVLSYNGEEVDSLLSDAEIRKIAISSIQPGLVKASQQMDIFN